MTLILLDALWCLGIVLDTEKALGSFKFFLKVIFSSFCCPHTATPWVLPFLPKVCKVSCTHSSFSSFPFLSQYLLLGIPSNLGQTQGGFLLRKLCSFSIASRTEFNLFIWVKTWGSLPMIPTMYFIRPRFIPCNPSVPSYLMFCFCGSVHKGPPARFSINCICSLSPYPSLRIVVIKF